MKIYGCGSMDSGLGFMVYGLWFMSTGFMVYGLWFMSTGGKAGLSIRKHDHFTPAREMRRDIKALAARERPEGRYRGYLI